MSQITRKVFTFFEPVPELAKESHTRLLDMWRQSWERNGWEAHILCLTDAQSHPLYKEYMEQISALPTVNPKLYEISCYARWLAILNQGGGLMTDTDVMNYGFTPEMCAEQVGDNDVMMFERHVPCCVFGTVKGFEKFVNLFKDYIPDANDMERGRPHVSDMMIIQRYWGEKLFPHCFICKEHSDPGWHDAPIVHFTASKVGRSKAERIAAIEETKLKKKYHLSIIQPFYKRLDGWKRALANNDRYLKGHQVVLVLDEPTCADEVVKTCQQTNKEIHWKVLLNKNDHPWRNPPRAINVGLRNAEGRNAMVICCESLMVGDVPGQLMAAHYNQPKVAHGGYVTYADPLWADKFKHADVMLTHAESLGWKSNQHGGLLAPLDVFWELGGYDERFTQWGMDDTDFLIRLGFNGTPAMHHRSVNILHFNHDAPRRYYPETMMCSMIDCRSPYWCEPNEWGRDFQGEIIYES